MFEESTAPYLVTAYVVFLGGIVGYWLSLRLRSIRLEREAAVLDQIAAEMEAERTAAQGPGA